MSTIKATLEVQPDGTVHLPLPPDFKFGTVHVEATLVPAVKPAGRIKLGLLRDVPGPFWIAPDFDEPLEDFREYME